MLSQILFFESMWLSTSDKLALKKGFLKLYQNKVVQLPNNEIVKEITF